MHIIAVEGAPTRASDEDSSSVSNDVFDAPVASVTVSVTAKLSGIEPIGTVP